MEMIYNLISEEIIQALGWTLIHSIWQGLLVATLMSIILYGIRAHSARVKYLVANIALLFVLILSVLTFIDLYDTAAVDSSNFYFLDSSRENILIHLGHEAGMSESLSSFFNEHLDVIAFVWLLGLLFFIVKILSGLVYLEFLKRTKLTISPIWEQRLEGLKAKLNYSKPIKLALSSAVSVPLVIGTIKPLILFPIGMINKLSQDEVESILAHELSHIVRNDYLFNIVQSIIESLLYFNPGVWWISAIIRSERENCCDDIAVDLSKDSMTYARALVGVEEFYDRTPSLAMGLLSNKKILLGRIKRILNQPQNQSKMKEKYLVSGSLILGLFFFALQTNTAEQKKLIHSNEENQLDWLANPEPIYSSAPEILDLPKYWNIPDKINKSKKYKPRNEISSVVTANRFSTSLLDTIPFENKKPLIKVEEDSKPSFKLEMKDGEVKELIIDGEKISENDFDLYIKDSEPTKRDWLSKKKEINADLDEELKSILKTAEEYKREAKIYLERSLSNREDITEEREEELELYKEKLELQLERAEVQRERSIEKALRKLEKESDILELKNEEFQILFDDEIERIDLLALETMEEVESIWEDIEHDIFENIESVMEMESSPFDNLKNTIVNKLLEDGLLDSEDEYNVVFKKNEMKVNGKSLDPQIRERYINMIEDIYGYEWRNKNKMIISKRRGFEKSNLRLDGKWNLEFKKS